MSSRLIVQIDESKCDGCGLCVPACAEGAIQIVDGKARLVSDRFCDGLGACLGKCPRGAIAIICREAEPFDQQAASSHAAEPAVHQSRTAAVACPGSAVQELPLSMFSHGAAAPGQLLGDTGEDSSPLAHWPIQLHLVPPDAPFLSGADLWLVADCVPFAIADFHGRLLRRQPVVIGCPKLDDTQVHVNKLAAIFRMSSVKSLTVVHMEVPCCTGLVRIARAAMQASGRNVPLEELTISIRGKLIQAGAKAAD